MGKSNISDTVRKIELLARILNHEKITKSEAVEDYNIKEVTINRALQFYRSIGIEAFGRKNGIKIFNEPDKKILFKLAAEYLSIKLNSDYFINSIKTYSKIDPNFFAKIVLTSKAVSEILVLKMKYQRISDNVLSNYVIKPYRIIEGNNNWVMHAIKEGETILKTFYLSRINDLKLTSRHFKKVTVEEKTSDKMEIVLRFVPQVEQELYYKIWFDEFMIEKDNEGNIILRTNQIINNKLAAWCISWWDAMKVVEPRELKEYIAEMYKDFASVND